MTSFAPGRGRDKRPTAILAVGPLQLQGQDAECNNAQSCDNRSSMRTFPPIISPNNQRSHMATFDLNLNTIDLAPLDDDNAWHEQRLNDRWTLRRWGRNAWHLIYSGD